jgi:hypothetical protein
MGIWNHWQPVTITLVDPDFDSRLEAWVTAGLQTIPLCSGCHQQPVTIALVDPDPDFDSQLKALVTARLQTIPLCSG